ncbi:MAG: rod shape-determining protein MreC [Candidatus Buchananbacteria bacterium]
MKKIFSTKYLYFLLAVLLLIFLHWLGLTTSLEKLAANLIQPVQKSFFTLGNFISSPTRYLTQQTKLLAENENLTKEKTVLLQKIVQTGQCLQENESLKKQLGYLQETKLRYLTAQIITRDPASDTILIIDRGSASGLTPGLAVITDTGLLLGKIIKTNDNTSFVRLLNDNLSKVAVTLQNNNQLNALVTGKYGLSLTMEQIPQDQKVNSEDLVITSGLEQNIPRGLLVGQVDKVTQKPGEYWQTAYLKTLFNLNQISLVTIILP